MFLRQSTAIEIAIGPFLDATDGVTAEPGLTITQADVRLKKNGAAWAQANQSSAATYEENGWYEKSLDTTDTNTVGKLLVGVAESGAVPVWHEFFVLPQVIFDALFASGANAFAGAAGATTLGTTAAEGIANTYLDLANAVETGLTPRQAQRVLTAAVAGLLSGGGTNTEVVRNAVANSKVRITATVDSSGNRTAIVFDLT